MKKILLSFIMVGSALTVSAETRNENGKTVKVVSAGESYWSWETFISVAVAFLLVMALYGLFSGKLKEWGDKIGK